jgi:acyl-CoA dehydrogenase
MFLLNPRDLVRHYPDPRSREIMQKTVDFFERKGLARLKEDFYAATWYGDFLDFVREQGIFAAMMTPAAHGGDGEQAVWDSWRVCGFAEILGFYGLPYWYTYQVSVLGIGPIWMSRNKVAQARAKRLLDEGNVFAFGLSEKEHGADIYASDMRVTEHADGSYRATGGKYYIGNANKARMISTFGKLADSDEYVFFVVDSQAEGFELVGNVVHSQNYVAEFRLHDYRFTEEEMLHRGDEAWNAALNTVNIGKYNLGWASIGICTHAFFEAIDHASGRHLYGKAVSDFPHVRQLFIDAYARLVAMKLFALRAADYMKSASAQDRRYLLFNPIVKMKVTTQGEEVINLLWDVIAAKGFEKEPYFSMAAIEIRGLPKLEGTVHVNMALIVKFMANYFFAPAEYPEVPRRDDGADDAFLFDQGPTKGLGKIRFHDYRIAYDSWELPNVALFRQQIDQFRQLLQAAPPDEQQAADVDFLLTVGEMFTLVVYGQLVLENARIYATDPALVDQIFDTMVRDFSKFALQLHSKPSSSDEQMRRCLQMICRPAVDPVRFDTVWNTHVAAMRGQYRMSP